MAVFWVQYRIAQVFPKCHKAATNYPPATFTKLRCGLTQVHQIIKLFFYLFIASSTDTKKPDTYH